MHMEDLANIKKQAKTRLKFQLDSYKTWMGDNFEAKTHLPTSGGRRDVNEKEGVAPEVEI